MKKPFVLIGKILAKDFKAIVRFENIINKVYLSVCYYRGELDAREE
jgi:hypothetical protein